MQSNPIIQSII